MPLASGSKLGAYEVLSPLGTGGMGEVYRARDTRLGREVAIKVLPADWLHDEERRRRFVREAQSASALNHPHIITIYEIESDGAIDFIVMEYVRGMSLDALIPRKGLRLPEVLRIATAVADALAAAHAGGIIHRDLKPANVMVGESGAVKVLDFGLAKLVAADAIPDDGTVTQGVSAGLSVPGAIMGTAAYMAPEQATGGKVDARSDIFSFGAMLYEMATGTRAFAGSSVADTLAAVIRDQPAPPTQIAAGVPRELERLILRCLRKEPTRRYQTMLDVRNEVQEIKDESVSATLTGTSALRLRKHRGLMVAAAASAVVLVAAAAWYFRQGALPELPPMRVVPLTSLNGGELWPTLSPDGEQVAFSWAGEKDSRPGRDTFDIYLKLVGSSGERRLTTDPGRNWVGGWSPDGRQIAYFRDSPRGAIYLLSPVTGTQRKLIDFPVTFGLAWSPDSRWLIAAGDPTQPDRGGIYAIPVDGGAPRRVVQSKPAQALVSPALAPDGHHLAYLACEFAGSRPTCGIDVVELDERWQPVSASRRLANKAYNLGGVVWSPDGTSVIYTIQPLPETFYLSRAWITGNRAPERLDLAGQGARMPAMASARNRVAFVRTYNTVGVYTLGAAPRSVLVSSFWDIQPQFSRDGTKLAFASSRSGEALDIWLAAADGSNAHQLTQGPGSWQGSPSWSPDGRQIAFDSRGADDHQSIWIIDAEGGGPRRITNGPGDQRMPTWSPDGWIYFAWDQGQRPDVWRVRETGGSPEPVTRDGSAFSALVSMDGKELIYKREFGDSALLTRPVAGGPVRQLLPCVSAVNFTVGDAGIYYAACGSGTERSIHLFDRAGRDRELGRIPDIWAFRLNRLAVTPDGKTILIQQQSISNDLMLIENFR